MITEEPWVVDPGERATLEQDMQEDAAGQEPKMKRRVSYNPDAVLCPGCTKRIRLNNNGCIRIHRSGKAGSGQCSGSNTKPAESDMPRTKNDMGTDSKKVSNKTFQKEAPAPGQVFFSDPE